MPEDKKENTTVKFNKQTVGRLVRGDLEKRISEYSWFDYFIINERTVLVKVYDTAGGGQFPYLMFTVKYYITEKGELQILKIE